MGAGMNLLAWLTGTWKTGAWKASAWLASDAQPEIDVAFGGAVPRRTDDPQKRRKRDDETLLMIGAL